MRSRDIMKRRWGVTFDSTSRNAFHSYADLGLLPASPPLFGEPKVKTSTVDIPGSNGRLDLTSIFGFIPYDNRTATLTYFLPDRREAWQKAVRSRLRALLHGKTLDVTPDEEPDIYYRGRWSVDEIVPAVGGSTITITGDLEPYRYDHALTSDDNWLWDSFSFENGVIREYEAIEIDGETEVTLVSSPLGGFPTITNRSNETMTLRVLPAAEFELPPGTPTELAALELPRGYEEVTWTIVGSGTVSIYFRTGSL